VQKAKNLFQQNKLLTTFTFSFVPNLSTVEIPLHSNVRQTASCQWHVTSGFMFMYI